MDRDLKYAEFFCIGKQAGNAGWSNAFVNTPGEPRNAGLLKLDTLNRNIQQWYVYAYLWCDASSEGATFQGRLAFYDEKLLVSTIPVCQLVCSSILTSNLATTNYYLSLANAGLYTTTPEANSLGVTLAVPQTGTAPQANEPYAQIYLKPMTRLGGFTKVQFDVMSFRNVSPDTLRVIIALRPV